MTGAVHTLVRINPQVAPTEFMRLEVHPLADVGRCHPAALADRDQRARSVSALERRALKGVDMRLSTLVAYLDAIGVVMAFEAIS